jgi:hypothetical protein
MSYPHCSGRVFSVAGELFWMSMLSLIGWLVSNCVWLRRSFQSDHCLLCGAQMIELKESGVFRYW